MYWKSWALRSLERRQSSREQQPQLKDETTNHLHLHKAAPPNPQEAAIYYCTRDHPPRQLHPPDCQSRPQSDAISQVTSNSTHPIAIFQLCRAHGCRGRKGDSETKATAVMINEAHSPMRIIEPVTYLSPSPSLKPSMILARKEVEI